MLTNMKWFMGASDLSDMDKTIETMKAAERCLMDAFVSNPKGHKWTKAVPVRKREAQAIRSLLERVGKVRQDMQEDAFQYRKYRNLPPPTDGYS